MRDEEATALLAAVPEDERYATWHLARPGRAPVGLGGGGRELLLTLRLTKQLGRASLLVPDKALDAAYGLVARHRSWLGRLVPEGKVPRRYP